MITREAPRRGAAMQRVAIPGEQVQEPADAAVLAGAARLASRMAEIDRSLRSQGVTIPPQPAKAELASEFWAFAALMDQCEEQGRSCDSLRDACRQQLGKWLFRSRYWNRAYHKPHGYAGDFRMIEWLYDLEGCPCEDPTQPAIVNCMDFLMSTVHSTRMLWERRRWFLSSLRQEHARCEGPLRVLDVASGGARYLRDFLLDVADASRVEVSLVDQDAAALAFCRSQSLAPWASHVTTHCTRIRDLEGQLAPAGFDMIICAGVMDYLSDESARTLLRQLSRALAPDGLLAFSNFHPSDPSRSVKDWLVDWRLCFRLQSTCAQLLPEHLAIQTECSSDGTLVFASARRRD